MVASMEQFGRTLVVAPHADDEVLGAGGTMARLAEAGVEVHVAVVTEGQPPAYSDEYMRSLKSEAAEAHRMLGVKGTHWLAQPAAQLGELAHGRLNAALRRIVVDLDPRTIMIPFLGDIHLDHQRVFLSSLVASRPHQADYPRLILAYETMSETNWNAPYITPSFVPNMFIDIEGTLDRKLEAMAAFSSQLRAAPHERSLESLRALATLRGATVHRGAAEAFIVIRNVL